MIDNYRVLDDLTVVYSSLLEPHVVNDDFREWHYQAGGKLKSAILNRVAWHNPMPHKNSNVFVLVGQDAQTNEASVEIGYGPGEVDLTFLYLFDLGLEEKLTDGLLYWLAGLR